MDPAGRAVRFAFLEQPDVTKVIDSRWYTDAARFQCLGLQEAGLKPCGCKVWFMLAHFC